MGPIVVLTIHVLLYVGLCAVVALTIATCVTACGICLVIAITKHALLYVGMCLLVVVKR